MNHVSLDVFDTALRRKLYDPKDVFVLAAYLFLRKFTVPERDWSVRDIVKLRIIAEIRARRKSVHEDISLSDIYAEMSDLCKSKLDLNLLSNLELSVECDVIEAIPSVLRMINDRCPDVSRRLFLSDMYLPKEVIGDLLLREGYDHEDKNLYVSGLLGLTKRSGSLFHKVLSDFSLDPAALEHIGDNIHSDYKVPESLGVRSSYRPVFSAPERFKSNYLQSSSCLVSRLKGWAGRYSKVARASMFFQLNDNLVVSYLAGSSYLSLVRAELEDRGKTAAGSEIEEFSYYIAAPMVLSFVCWLSNQVADKKINRLFFVARNGQIFYRIASILKKELFENVELGYLYASRSTLYPGMMLADLDALPEFALEKYPGISVDEFLCEIGVSSSCRELIAGSLFSSSNRFFLDTSKEVFLAYLREVLVSPFRKVVEDALVYKRDNLCRYLGDAGFIGEGEVAIVDVGWSLSSHVALYESIKECKPEGFSGFYYGLSHKHLSVNEKSPAYAFVTQSDFQEFQWFFKLGAMAFFEEVVCAADHGTTAGYSESNGAVRPKLKEVGPGARSEELECVRNIIISCAHRARRSYPLADWSGIGINALKAFQRFYLYPKASAGFEFSNIEVYTLTQHSRSQRRYLCKPITVREAVYIWLMVLSGRRKDVIADWVWLQGSVAISSVFVRFMYRIVAKFFV